MTDAKPTKKKSIKTKKVSLKPASPDAPKKETSGYYRNVSRMDQVVTGPDGSTRVIPPRGIVHKDQARSIHLVDSPAVRGRSFLSIRNLDIVKEDSSKRILVVGGPENNARGAYRPK